MRSSERDSMSKVDRDTLFEEFGKTIPSGICDRLEAFNSEFAEVGDEGGRLSNCSIDELVLRQSVGSANDVLETMEVLFTNSEFLSDLDAVQFDAVADRISLSSADEATLFESSTFTSLDPPVARGQSPAKYMVSEFPTATETVIPTTEIASTANSEWQHMSNTHTAQTLFNPIHQMATTTALNHFKVNPEPIPAQVHLGSQTWAFPSSSTVSLQPPTQPQLAHHSLRVACNSKDGINNNSSISNGNGKGKTPRSRSGRWSAEQDNLLRQAVDTHGARNWKRIAQLVPGRCEAQVLERWTKVLRPGIRKGHWTSAEDAVLCELMGKGVKTRLIAQKLPGRTTKQIRERWKKYLDPSLNRSPFTPDEDKVILRQYAEWGRKWAAIAKCLSNRTGEAVKHRCVALLKSTNGSHTSSGRTSSVCTDGQRFNSRPTAQLYPLHELKLKPEHAQTHTVSGSAAPTPTVSYPHSELHSSQHQSAESLTVITLYIRGDIEDYDFRHLTSTLCQIQGLHASHIDVQFRESSPQPKRPRLEQGHAQGVLSYSWGGQKQKTSVFVNVNQRGFMSLTGPQQSNPHHQHTNQGAQADPDYVRAQAQAQVLERVLEGLKHKISEEEIDIGWVRAGSVVVCLRLPNIFAVALQLLARAQQDCENVRAFTDENQNEKDGPLEALRRMGLQVLQVENEEPLLFSPAPVPAPDSDPESTAPAAAHPLAPAPEPAALPSTFITAMQLPHLPHTAAAFERAILVRQQGLCFFDLKEQEEEEEQMGVALAAKPLSDGADLSDGAEAYARWHVSTRYKFSGPPPPLPPSVDGATLSSSVPASVFGSGHRRNGGQPTNGKEAGMLVEGMEIAAIAATAIILLWLCCKIWAGLGDHGGMSQWL